MLLLIKKQDKKYHAQQIRHDFGINIGSTPSKPTSSSLPQ
ncbi:protein of unknown function [Shewanella benthica]|uniref:Uncharacterized protein n=1 Tax=Shewanella benthica TaxID=43661 RepID=A0A330M877_9GAMM|nr:protein of unknown function [Shewanella benthica]